MFELGRSSLSPQQLVLFGCDCFEHAHYGCLREGQAEELSWLRAWGRGLLSDEEWARHEERTRPDWMPPVGPSRNEHLWDLLLDRDISSLVSQLPKVAAARMFESVKTDLLAAYRESPPAPFDTPAILADIVSPHVRRDTEEERAFASAFDEAGPFGLDWATRIVEVAEKAEERWQAAHLSAAELGSRR